MGWPVQGQEHGLSKVLTFDIVFLCPREIKGGEGQSDRGLGKRGGNASMDLGCVAAMRMSEMEKKFMEETEV